MPEAKLYCIGSQCRKLDQWREIFGNTMPTDPAIKGRVKKGMFFIEAITWVKPDVIYVGEVYNGCEVLEVPIKEVKAKCKARCHCGKEFNPIIGTLKNGTSTSCGCSRKGTNKTHGLHDHVLYQVWYDMNKRCNNPNSTAYYYYGAVGITVCPEWHWDNPNGLANFVDDMYPTYKKGYKLDKDIKAIKGQPKTYSKLTCCWVTTTDNNRAKSMTKLIENQVKEIKRRLATGLEKQKDIAADYNVSPCTISDIDTGKTWKDVNY